MNIREMLIKSIIEKKIVPEMDFYEYKNLILPLRFSQDGQNTFYNNKENDCFKALDAPELYSFFCSLKEYFKYPSESICLNNKIKFKITDSKLIKFDFYKKIIISTSIDSTLIRKKDKDGYYYYYEDNNNIILYCSRKCNEESIFHYNIQRDSFYEAISSEKNISYEKTTVNNNFLINYTKIYYDLITKEPAKYVSNLRMLNMHVEKVVNGKIKNTNFSRDSICDEMVDFMNENNWDLLRPAEEFDNCLAEINFAHREEEMDETRIPF